MRSSTPSLIALLALLGGCTATGEIDAGSVRSSADEQTPIAVWLPTRPEGETQRATTREIVLDVFQNEGLHPQRQEYGVSVPEAEAPRAREILVTNDKFKGMPFFVFCAVGAGTAVKTQAGFEVPSSAIMGDCMIPTTTPSP